MNPIQCLIAGALLACFASAVGAAAADAGYPNRPIRLIAPFVPGGPSDIMARLVAQKLSESMKQQMIVDNRGAAGGIVGFEIAARAAPDGYTLLLASGGGLTMNPSLYDKLPYDPLRDYEPVTQLSSGPQLMVVHPALPTNSVSEFIALAKAKPGYINFASAGTGNRVAAEMFRLAANVNIVNIPYKGTGQALADLIAGHVHMMMANILAGAPHARAGRLRALGVTSLKRNSALPEIPTVSESGLPGFESVSWHAIVLPAKTPQPIVRRLHTELVKMLAEPEVRERFATQGLDPVGSTPEAFAAHIREETVKYAKIIKAAGLKAD
jgi:tripartite-type tricarboxylate transporter receptor subunit TctC